MSLTILLADDNATFAAAIRQFLQMVPGAEVVGQAQTGREALVLARQLRPDLAVLDIGMPDMSGYEVARRMRDLQTRVPQLGDVRGLGSMIGLEFVRDAQTREPAPAIATRVAEHALRHGLVLLKAGLYGNVIRNLAPLVITDEQLAEALDVLEAAIEHAVATVAA